VLAVVAVAAAMWARHRHNVRLRRNVDLASLGLKVGTTYASTAARKVFASAERRIELDAERELRTAEALSGLLRVLGSGNETAPTRDLDDPALQSLAAGGLLARDAEGRWGVPLALRGGVARGIVLAIEILAAATKSSEPLV